MTTVAKTSEPVAKLDRALRAPKSSLKPQGHTRQMWWHRAGPGVTQDSIRHQEYWENLAPQLTRHDIIMVLAEDETWEVELCVERVMTGAVTVSVRKVYKRDGVVHAGRVVDGLGEFYSEWRSGLGWCIIRRSDNHPVIQGHTLEATVISQWQRERPKMANAG